MGLGIVYGHGRGDKDVDALDAGAFSPLGSNRRRARATQEERGYDLNLLSYGSDSDPKLKLSVGRAAASGWVRPWRTIAVWMAIPSGTVVETVPSIT